MTGRQFKARLVLLGLTQKEFSEIMQVSTKTVNTVCNAPRVPMLWQWALYGYEFRMNKEV